MSYTSVLLLGSMVGVPEVLLLILLNVAHANIFRTSSKVFKHDSGDKNLSSGAWKLLCQNVPTRPNATLTSSINPDPFTTDDPTTQARLTLRRDLFSSKEDNISYYAVLVADAKLLRPPTCGTWGGDHWPPLPSWSPPGDNGTDTYQATPTWWNPFNNTQVNSIEFVLGEKTCLVRNGTYCNAHLQPGTEYGLKVRAFTLRGFQDSEVLFFTTFAERNVLLPLIIILGVLLVTLAALVVYYLINGNFKSLTRMNPRESSSIMPLSMNRNQFQKFSKELLENQGMLSSEFHLLGTLSMDVTTHSMHGRRNDNRNKNRYANILPFDLSRVELSIQNEDPSSDYINASFIKGFSEQTEYIATQGPLEHTCEDFWRMVYEQQARTIVMLGHLVEEDREKCYKYFPELGQTLTFGHFEVTCLSTEIEEFVCIKRHLRLTRESSPSLDLVHLHFTEWTDFGCPSNTESTLKLCDLMSRAASSLTVVHCSAGVGRTGTLIAIHILLQDVRHNSNKLNVFSTVLNLRQQRGHMVQTDSQYAFIYQCISDFIAKHSPTKSILKTV